MIVNNVDLDKIAKTVEEGKKDKSSLKRAVKLQGEWNLDPSKHYQFRTEIQYEKGREVLEIDSPSYLGGGGNRPGPMAYCVAGMTSCLISTFATVAAMQGVRLSKLAVSSECDISFAKTLDVADKPITEGITIEIEAKSENADKKRLQELVRMAEERCPAIYSMTHKIDVKTRLK